MNKIIIVCGPTATGKTQLALDIAKIYNGELVSADSRQIYRKMDIGTGKDLSAIKRYGLQLMVKYHGKNYLLKSYLIKDIPLWMYDVVNPNEEFSVSHYHNLANTVINYIINRGKMPIVVGGTGLYIKSLVKPIETIDIPQDRELRNQLNLLTLDLLQNKIKDDYPEIWKLTNASDRSNPRRLVRKIEIAQYRTKHQNVKTNPTTTYFNSLFIGLMSDYPYLYSRIDARVDARVKSGIINEIDQLLKSGYNWDLIAFKSLGYQEWADWFHDPDKQTEPVKNQIIQQWKFDEHGYARRQLTWFKKQSDINWFDINNMGYLEKVKTIVAAWYTNK